MRLSDILEAREYIDQKILSIVDKKLKAGECVEINDAFYTQIKSILRGPYNWGILEKLKYARKLRETMRDYARESWIYEGPAGSSIKVLTQASKLEHGQMTHYTIEKILKPGQGSDPVDVDES